MKGLLFTYALTYGGAVVALFNPFYGLLIYISFAILRPDSLWFWSVPPGNYSRILAIATLIGWAGHGFGNWNFRGARPIVFALLGYGATLILGACLADDQKQAWDFTEGQFKTILPFVIGVTLIDSLDKLKKTAWVIFLSQAYLALHFNQNYLNGAYPIVGEIRFSYFESNGLGIINATAAGLAFFLGLAESVWWRRWGAFAAAALMAHVPMFCMARGAMLGLVVVGIVAFLILPKQPKHYLLFAMAVIVGLRLAGPAVVEKFMTSFAEEEERDASAQSRVVLWKVGWQIMLDHPVTGLGPAQWRTHAPQYGFPPGRSMQSSWFETGADLGFPGLFFLLGFYGIAAGRLWRLLRLRSLDPWLANTARMVIASVAGFVVSATFMPAQGVELPYYVVMLGAGALKLAEQRQSALQDQFVAPDLFVSSGSAGVSPACGV